MTAPNMSTVLHIDCVGCQEGADPSTSEAGALTVLAMLSVHTVDEIIRALCFKHRRDVDIAAKAVVKAASR